MPDPPDSSDLGFDLDDDAWLKQAREALSPDVWDNLGDYEILNEVSRGGQGVVLRARTADGQIVAIKRLLAGTLTGTRGRLRFEREMEIAARLQHPGIVPLLRRDIVDRQPLLVMPWVEGLPPNRWARPQNGPARNQRQILRLLLGICDAITHAHHRGVIHRDLKPSNILVDAHDQPHVLDFGIGKLLQEDAEGTHEITRTSEFVGSPTFAPPERLLGSRSALTRIRKTADRVSFTGKGSHPGRRQNQVADFLRPISGADFNGSYRFFKSPRARHHREKPDAPRNGQ